MALNFNYKTIKRPDGTKVRTPSIPILIKENEVFETLALVDSGADISALPHYVAEIVGLELKGEKEHAYGIGGEVDAIETTMNILIEKGHEKYNFRIPVKVILGDYDFPVILGRTGFFDKFTITFDQTKEKIILKKNRGTIS